MNSRKFTIGLMASSFILSSGTIPNAYALGVGAAETDSFIGEQLSVSIPLFNVVDPNSLSINFESSQFDGDGQAKVNATLDRSNSQLSIKISSDTVVNEPYINFTLDLIDNNTEFSKEFTVLMDLRAGNSISSAAVPSIDDIVNTSVSDVDNSTYVVPQAVPIVGSVMGPYDIAEAGRIAEKFGAVLDGQSLWRVARRINEAMGVSRSQMMWSLYQANPSAFSGRSVSSLKAGSFLTIPDVSVVQSVSHDQAKANLAALRSGNQDSAPQSDLSVAQDNVGAADEFSFDEADQESVAAAEQTDSSSFQVTGVGQATADADGSLDKQSQEIISSLSETIGSLSQQLSRRDQKIEFLENQIVELKSFIDSGVVAGASDSVPELESDAELLTDEPDEELLTDEAVLETDAEIVTDLEVSAEPDLAIELESEPVVALSDDSVAPEVDTVVTSGVNSVQTQPSSGFSGFINTVTAKITAAPVWQLALLCLLVLSLLAFFIRGRLAALFRALNLFGPKEDVELNSVVIVEDLYNTKAKPKPYHEPKLESDEITVAKDYSVMTAAQNTTSDEELLDGISYLDIDDDGTFEANEILEIETEEADAGLEDLSFEERFERLLAENDFDFARELLDFARHNEINDERYHCERLRLLGKMKDEDGFYEYYYEIESQIPTFPQNLQTKISQLVVELARH